MAKCTLCGNEPTKVVKRTPREEVIHKLNVARALLVEAAFMIQDENKDGKQFDYCTSSELANCADRVVDTVKKINTIVYQE